MLGNENLVRLELVAELLCRIVVDCTGVSQRFRFSCAKNSCVLCLLPLTDTCMAKRITVRKGLCETHDTNRHTHT